MITKKENKIAVRVKPLKKWSDVAMATKHGRREDLSKHVDPDRTKDNLHWQLRRDETTNRTVLRPQDTGADIEEAFLLRAKENGAKWRKNAIVGTELMFIASPEFFLDKDDPGYKAHAKKWAVDCIKAATKKFPGMIAAARLDLDETTPHLSLFFLPIYAKTVTPRARKDGKRNKPRAPHKTVSHNTLFGGTGDEGPKKLSALQDWAEEAMQEAGHDLKRGKRKLTVGQDHVPPAEGRRRIIEAAKAEAARIVAEAQQEADTTLEALSEAKATIEADLSAERTRFLDEAKEEGSRLRRSLLPADYQKLEDENKMLKAENKRQTELAESWFKKAKEFEAFLEVTRATLARVLGDGFQAIRSSINTAWAKHPDNPDKASTAAPRSESGLPGSSRS